MCCRKRLGGSKYRIKSVFIVGKYKVPRCELHLRSCGDGALLCWVGFRRRITFRQFPATRQLAHTRNRPVCCALQVPLLTLIGILVLLIPLAIIGAVGLGTKPISYVHTVVVGLVFLMLQLLFSLGCSAYLPLACWHAPLFMPPA